MSRRPDKPKKPRAKAPAKSGRGGARPGAGRPRDRLPAKVIERLGVPPKDDAAALDLWVRGVLAELLVLQMSGEVGTELAASLRATCGEIRRNLPEKAGGGSEDDEDEDDDQDDGPETEEVKSDGSLRVER
jgi:hypothetical protein